MSQPLVSILAPIRNSKAMVSLLAQSYGKLELLILDHPSADSPQRDPRVKFVRDWPAEAAGDAVMIGGDENEYHPDYVQKMVEQLDRNPTADMAWSNAWRLTARGEREDPIIASPEEAYPASRPILANYCDFIQRRDYAPIIFGLFRAEALRRIMPYEAFDESGADAENLFIARFFLRELRAAYLHEPLFGCRPRPPNLEGRGRPLLLWLGGVRHQLRFHRRLCEELRAADLPDLQFRYARAATLQTFVQQSRLRLESVRCNRPAWWKTWWYGARRIRWMLDNTFPLASFDRIEPALARLQPEVVLDFCSRSRERLRAIGGWADYAAGLIGAAQSEPVTDLHALLEAEDAAFADDEKAIRSGLPRRAAILARDRAGELYAGVRDDTPDVSVISCSFNLAPLVEETLLSVGRQTCRSYEHIVVDGASTDGTPELLKRYPKVRWISEPDGGVLDGLWKGLRMARGKYVMQCCISDGYLDPDWLSRCVAVLDADPQVSLVWGFRQGMTEDSWLDYVLYAQWQHRAVPQKSDWLAQWLESAFWFPEDNFCARREVFERCLPPFCPESLRLEPFLEFSYRFNSAGYLPFHLPVVADFARRHAGQTWHSEVAAGIGLPKMAIYRAKVRRYRRRLALGTATHVFRDGAGNPLEIPVPLAWIRRRLARTTARDVVYGLRNRLRRGGKP